MSEAIKQGGGRGESITVIALRKGRKDRGWEERKRRWIKKRKKMSGMDESRRQRGCQRRFDEVRECEREQGYVAEGGGESADGMNRYPV